MKLKITFITLFFLFLFSNDVMGQGYRPGGVDRSIAREPQTKKKKEEKKDYGETWAEYLNKDLKLDGLQFAAVKNIMNDNKDRMEEIMKQDISTQEKRDKLLIISDDIDEKIIKLLSPEQKKIYMEKKEEREKKALRS